MTIRHMKIFLNVCEHMSMTAAAKKMHISQSSVSQAIGELESQYNIRLFNRISRKLYLTTHGEIMRDHAKKVMSIMNEIDMDIKNINAEKISLKIGTTVTIGDTFFVNLIEEFKMLHNNYEIFTMINNVEHIEDMVAEGKIDAAIVAATSIGNKDLERLTLHHDDLVLVYSRAYPIDAYSQISVEEITKHNLILREQGSSIRQTLDSLYLDLNIVGEYTSFTAILKAVSSNFGVSILPKIFVTQSNDPNIHYVNIDNEEFKRKYYLIFKKANPNKENIDLFTEFCFRYIKTI